jgi:hypothetical protein
VFLVSVCLYQDSAKRLTSVIPLSLYALLKRSGL